MTQDEFTQGVCEFLDAAVTPFHAVERMGNLLLGAGFQALPEGDEWQIQPGGKYFVTRNGSALIAFIQGRESRPQQGARLVGAHTDSPCLMVKPNPELRRQGYLQLGVQVYGGALLNPWFDRDLNLAGKVSFLCSDGTLDTRLVNFARPVGCIPSLAIHLDREANNARTVNPQKDMPVLLGQVGKEESRDLKSILADFLTTQEPDLPLAEIMDFELSFVDCQPAAVIGLDNEFLASARLDNLLSCYIGLQSLLHAGDEENALLVCTDHEEVGSQSASGAQGPFLASCLRRWAGSEQACAEMVASSLLVSADNAHGIHPNFADKHDENHGPKFNEGPVIKVNANQRYATNSETAAFFRLLCRQEGVPVQAFVVRSDMGCGSTIGPITSAATGVPTLDVGVPTFAMHSIRELAGTDDAWHLYKVLQRFYRHPGKLA